MPSPLSTGPLLKKALFQFQALRVMPWDCLLLQLLVTFRLRSKSAGHSVPRILSFARVLWPTMQTVPGDTQAFSYEHLTHILFLSARGRNCLSRRAIPRYPNFPPVNQSPTEEVARGVMPDRAAVRAKSRRHSPPSSQPRVSAKPICPNAPHDQVNQHPKIQRCQCSAKPGPVTLDGLVRLRIASHEGALARFSRLVLTLPSAII